MGFQFISKGKGLVPVILGGLGAVPFLTGAIYVAFEGPSSDPALIFALQIYGAVILSFLGGILWGRAVTVAAHEAQPAFLYIISVMPALLAWISLPLRPDYAFGLLALSFTAFRLVEMRLSGLPVPDWFAPLRNILTILVSLSMAVMALAL